MGLDLTIAVDDYHGLSTPSTYTRLAFHGRYYHLFDALEKQASPVGKILWYGDDGLKEVTTNPYGTPILSIDADEMIALIDSHKNADELGTWDVAVVAFIRALPPDTAIYLWFH